MINNLTYYGGFRTRKFADIFASASDFETAYDTIGLGGLSSTASEKTAQITMVWKLLYASYGNSHIANSDENQFKFKVFSTIFQYAPTWLKELELQEALRAMTIEQMQVGFAQTSKHAYNPETAPSSTDLNYTNEQTKSEYTKSKIDAIGNADLLLKTNVTDTFLRQFKKLFVKVAFPDYPLLYSMEVEDDNT